MHFPEHPINVLLLYPFVFGYHERYFLSRKYILTTTFSSSQLNTSFIRGNQVVPHILHISVLFHFDTCTFLYVLLPLT